VRYLGVIGLAERLGVTRHAVVKWRSRYPAGSSHQFPEPDVEIDGGVPGWLPSRLPEIEQWRAGMPGRGAGGGRPALRPPAESAAGSALADWERDLLDGGSSEG
jgi:hypothetical protein